MKPRSAWLVIVLCFLIPSLACETPIPSAEGLEDYAKFNERHWNAEEQRLENANCDINSDEAIDYRQCIQDQYVGASSTAGRENEGMGLWQWTCRVHLSKIPGCEFELPDLPQSGSATYACDVSHDAEGTYNDEYCPLGHSVELNIIMNWETRQFTYDFRATCIDDVLDFVYDYIRTETDSSSGGGTLTATGWLLGEYVMTNTRAYECAPPRYCGNTGSAPDTEVSEYSKYVVGRLATIYHLEMGFQNQGYPMDLETLSGFSSWSELESAYRGSKVYDCYLGN
ncbi:MAG: hypothetical protein PVF70_13670 [Anaerolineales bacterium]